MNSLVSFEIKAKKLKKGQSKKEQPLLKLQFSLVIILLLSKIKKKKERIYSTSLIIKN
jgi:hypothetical protein